MTSLTNDPASFSDDALEGFVDLYADVVRAVPGGVVRRRRSAVPKVAVLVGGGSGHYPAFAGLVGAGFADGAVVGNIFTSPSATQAYSVARAAETGAGVVFTYGNYAGDVMNFGLASERLAREGIAVENVLVTDDIASGSASEVDKRRGIAGDFTVFKVMGAAAEAGASLRDVVRIGRRANDRTRTLGAAFQGCTFPGAADRLFTLDRGQMALGLGIHGEPGLHDAVLPTADELGAELVARVLAEAPVEAGTRIAVILNGLGSTKHEELFVLWRTVAPLLRAAGYTLVAPEVGEIVTSLDMAGTSLTITWLDEELERLWLAPAETPGYRRGTPVIAAAASNKRAEGEQAEGERAEGEQAEESVARAIPESSAVSRDGAARAVDGLAVVVRTLRDAESMLGDLDAIAGDGDHGRGMVRGADAALSAAEAAAAGGAGLATTLRTSGDAWAERAGGTSGVLWGAGLRAMGETLDDTTAPDAPALAAAVGAFAARILELGKADAGDKTMVDALVPFTRSFESAIRSGIDACAAWARAASVATDAASATAALSPKRGRARPLAEKSIGTPDPGAISFALIVTALGGTAGRTERSTP